MLAGCNATTSDPPGSAHASSVAALPLNYRSMIVERARREFFDPYSIRDAAISQPIAGRALAGETASVCIRANAKNRMGGYTGIKTTAYIFRAGQITLSETELSGPVCEAASYEPFPELESAGTSAAPPAKQTKR